MRSPASGLLRVAELVLVAVLSACAREPVAPSGAARLQLRQPLRAEVASVVSVGALLDSFSIGGVYTVLPRGGYSGGSSYVRSPEKDVYAGTINQHPTGLAFPIGLPIRVLAEGRLMSRSTPAFQIDYCARYGATEPRCAVASFTYTIHGLADGPGVPRPYEPGMGLALTWSRSAGYYDRFYGLVPSAEFFRGRVPAADTATERELHFRRNGCCYYIPWGTTAAWETYEGRWRFGAVPDDGGQAELGVPAVLRLHGPRTDAPLAESAVFSVATTTGDAIATTRWWYVRAANNVFDGEPVPLVTITQPWTMTFPRYPDGQRAVFEELPACTGRRTCTYQAMAAGAVVVQATLGDGRVLAARNTGASGAHVRITADSTTLTYGDTTVFRVTAPGANELRVTGYHFVAVGGGTTSAVMAIRQVRALQASGSEAARNVGSTLLSSHSAVRQDKPAVAVERGTAVPVRAWKHFLDAAFECSAATVAVCYDDPPQTGYEIVTAMVDGEAQRDSVLVRVIPLVTIKIDSAGGPNPGGSFLTAQPRSSSLRENVITLKAQVSPASLAADIVWEVVAQDTLVRTVAPDSVRRGASTSFVVPVTNRDTSRRRWPGTPHHALMTDAAKAAQLLRKSLGYRITATITSNGQTVRSPSVVVRQDEIDTIREEYIEFGVDTVIPRGMFGQVGDPGRNTNTDYTIWVTEQDLIAGMAAMQAAARRKWHREVTVVSGYRNPVHHFKHARATARNSAHLRGRATDWRISDPPTELDPLTHRPTQLTAEQYFERLGRITKSDEVRGCFEPKRMIIDTSPTESLDHAHSHWERQGPGRENFGCPLGW